MAILCISREFGSGAKAIGLGVAEVTGYAYIDRSKMIADLKARGAECQEWVKNFEEHYPDVWEKYDWSFRGFTAVIQSLILNYAKKDRVILTGTGAGFLLKSSGYSLHVKIRAPIEARIKRVQGKDVVNGETARWLIEKADEEMAHAIYTLYGKHWEDPAEYDLIFDTSTKPRGEIVERIEQALAECEKYNTEQNRRMLELKALAAKIKATVAIDPTFSISTLEIVPKEEGLPEYGLVVRGIVHKEEDIKRVEDVATLLAGDAPMEFRLVYRWFPRLGPWQFK